MTEPRALGAAGPTVHPIGLGGASLSIAGRPPEDDGVRVILTALEHGATFIDTADAYCVDESEAGHNERLVARALREWGSTEGIVVGTKGGVRRPGGRWVKDGTPEHLRSACAASLQALGVERIDLYQLHAPDPRVPITESVGALEELRREGRVRWIGVSNVGVAELEAARTEAPILTVQNALSLWKGDAGTSGLLAICEAAGIGFLAHSPLGGHPRPEPLPGHDEVAAVARDVGATPAQVALAWLLARSPTVIPHPGTKSVEHVVEDLAAAEVELSAGQMGRLRKAIGG